jgi:hypothetical protein
MEMRYSPALEAELAYRREQVAASRGHRWVRAVAPRRRRPR